MRGSVPLPPRQVAVSERRGGRLCGTPLRVERRRRGRGAILWRRGLGLPRPAVRPTSARVRSRNPRLQGERPAEPPVRRERRQHVGERLRAQEPVVLGLGERDIEHLLDARVRDDAERCKTRRGRVHDSCTRSPRRSAPRTGAGRSSSNSTIPTANTSTSPVDDPVARSLFGRQVIGRPEHDTRVRVRPQPRTFAIPKSTSFTTTPLCVRDRGRCSPASDRGERCCRR